MLPELGQGAGGAGRAGGGRHRVFGEMALFGNGRRSGTVRASDTCECRSVDQHRFQRLLNCYPNPVRGPWVLTPVCLTFCGRLQPVWSTTATKGPRGGALRGSSDLAIDLAPPSHKPIRATAERLLAHVRPFCGPQPAVRPLFAGRPSTSFLKSRGRGPVITSQGGDPRTPRGLRSRRA